MLAWCSPPWRKTPPFDAIAGRRQRAASSGWNNSLPRCAAPHRCLVARGLRPVEALRVLYMHDGQNLFDGKLNWTMKSRADVAVSNLMKSGRSTTPSSSASGTSAMIDTPSTTPRNFWPLRRLPCAVNMSPGRQRETPAGCLVSGPWFEELPAGHRQSTYPAWTRSIPSVGSSIGGHNFDYALCEYPEVFGGAANIHPLVEPRRRAANGVAQCRLPLAAMMYLSKALPDAATHRITPIGGDDWLDSLYAPTHRMFAEAAIAIAVFPVRTTPRPSSPMDGTATTRPDWADRFESTLLYFLIARR